MTGTPVHAEPGHNEGKLHLYIVESGSYGGNSGSPVFFFLGSERMPGTFALAGRLIRLAGVMKGNFGEASPILMLNQAAAMPAARANIGVAAVVPAYQLREILFGAELKTGRGF